MKKIVLSKNEKYEKIHNVLLYLSHYEKDMFSLNLDEQEKKCKKYIASHELNLIKTYSDYGVEKIDLFERTGIIKLIDDIKTGKYKNHYLFVYSHYNLSIDLIVFAKFEEILKTNKMVIRTTTFNTENASGSLLYHNNLFYNDYIVRHELSKIFFLFSGKINNCTNNLFKGTFITLIELEKLLRTLGEDDFIEISSPANMYSSWRYKCTDNKNISDDIEIILKSDLLQFLKL